MKPSRFALAGVFCVSLAVLLLEITFTRVFSVTMWYHFAFMAISLALLGGAVGSVFLFALRRFVQARAPAPLLAVLAAAFAVSVPLAFALYLRIPFFPDQAATREGVTSLAAVYLAAALPFFVGGLCTAVALSVWTRDVGLVYCADLVGASLGCVVAILALDRLGGAGALLLAGAVAALGALAYSLAARRPAWSAGLALLTVALGALAAYSAQTGLFDVRSQKDPAYAVESGKRWERWNSFSRVTVGYHDTIGMPFGWGLSDTWTGDEGPNPGHRLITIDATAGTPIMRFDGDPESVSFLRYDITALVHYIRDDAKVLIIGLGGGRDALTAIVFGQKDITGLEINPLVYDAVALPEPEGFAGFAGRLFERPDLHVCVGDGRNFVARSQDRYDIIQAALADTWAASSAGAFSLTENSLYTTEAFRDYYRHLTGDGIVTFSRWYVPASPGETLRLVNLGLTAWRAEGVPDPERNLVVIANRVQTWGGRERVATMLLKRTPFTAEEIAVLAQVSDRMHFDVLYAPGTAADNDVARFVNSPDQAGFVAQFPVDISATSDDRPFFFYLFQPAAVFRPESAPETEIYKLSFQGVYILLALLAIVAVLAIVLIFVPLGALTRNLAYRGSARVISAQLAYFGCLGLAFILIEVPSIQRLVVFIGQPTYALAVVLFSLLLFSGLGSLFTTRIAVERSRRVLARVLAVLVALVVLCALAVPAVLTALLPLSLAARAAACVGLIAPLGLLMGMPFPLRLRTLSAGRSELVPWVWGVNGALSVLGSVLSVFISINAGLRITLLAGAMFYALAFVLVLRWRPAGEAFAG